MLNNKIIKKYNSVCNRYFTYNKFDKYKITFNTNNQLKYIILNNNIWCTYKIICSISNKQILWCKDMILIEKDILSDIKIPKNKENIEEYILDNLPDTSIGIIKNIIGNLTIYYEINKIIKS